MVAAELNTEGSKDVVIYKIRVADSTGEWTVSRRFRNFESLQRTLKELPGYRIRMPAKRVFTHSQNVGFVEERRQQLDQYLQQILGEDTLTGASSHYLPFKSHFLTIQSPLKQGRYLQRSCGDTVFNSFPHTPTLD